MIESTTPATRERPSRVVAASLTGTVIEWYEFFIYGTSSALVFSKLFFPNYDSFVGTLLSLSTFAIAFVARPVGAAVVGHYGDRVGRKTLLIVTLCMMGGATFLMGLLPTYASIGIAAPIALVVLRLIQGVSLGGEYGGAVLMSVEHAEPKRRGLFGGIINTGASCGLILATAVFFVLSYLPEESFMAWGWRVPFLLSAVLLVLGLVIRLKIAESPEFEQAKKRGKVQKLPLWTVITEHGGLVLLMAISYLPTGAVFYLSAVFSLSYGTETLGFSRSVMLGLVCGSNIIGIAGIVYGGALSDRISRQRVFMLGALGMVFVPWIWFFMMGTANLWVMFLAYLVLFAPFCLSYGAMPAYYAQVFPVHIRYSGMSVGYGIGTVLGAGLSPLIATALLGTDDNWPAVAMFLSVLALASFFATKMMPTVASDRDVVVKSPQPAQ
ncbi:MFS transporter [Mycolicibacterium wolinskyi]|uniref:MFS transporter n=1 Tax=Mycolicibacterium wolinskyi TaxID=59750 RepID=UPI003917ACA0